MSDVEQFPACYICRTKPTEMVSIGDDSSFWLCRNHRRFVRELIIMEAKNPDRPIGKRIVALERKVGRLENMLGETNEAVGTIKAGLLQRPELEISSPEEYEDRQDVRDMKAEPRAEPKDYSRKDGKQEAICGGCHETQGFKRFKNPDDEVWICGDCRQRENDGEDMSKATSHSQSQLEKMKKEGKI